MPPSRRQRKFVLDRANGRCEYCRIAAWELTVDHVIPPSEWVSGSAPGDTPDDPRNLAAACALCNRAKWHVTTAEDPVTGRLTRLFNPREDRWAEHFAWRNDYTTTLGLTPIGRATVIQLRLNREIYRQQRRLLRAAARAGEPPWP